jgi:quinoprotein glucose dehydrogenase
MKLPISGPSFTALILIAAVAAPALYGADRNWPSYCGDSARSHYSSLKQITPGNVQRLEVAWTYRSGDARSDNRSQIQCNPLIIDGVLYGTSAQLKLFALDAATGAELWRFDPFAGTRGGTTGVNRGVAYWSEGEDRRLLLIVDHFLHAIDARTGRPVDTFGEHGKVDIKIGLGRDVSKLYVAGSSPGAVFGNLLFVPMRLGEGPAPAAPGHIRAFDIRTGKQVWRFNTIPFPGEYGYDTWPPDGWTHTGAANCWAGFAVDEERGLLYAPTGSATFDFWGGDRIGSNLFANCLICIDARTGQRKWHYQVVHHDVWDRDLPAPPTLCTVKRGGKSIPAVAQVTKSGHVFVFNRETGEPLFPIEERAVPASDLQGESVSPTQPIPLRPAPFTRQLLTADDLTVLSPEAHRAALERFVHLRPHAQFLPPTREGTIIFPGFDGGAEWGGAAVDPDGVRPEHGGNPARETGRGQRARGFYPDLRRLPWEQSRRQPSAVHPYPGGRGSKTEGFRHPRLVGNRQGCDAVVRISHRRPENRAGGFPHLTHASPARRRGPKPGRACCR